METSSGDAFKWDGGTGWLMGYGDLKRENGKSEVGGQMVVERLGVKWCKWI